MKKIITIIALSTSMFLIPSPITAQSLNPGDPGGSPSGPPVGGGAPIGSGLFLLMGLGVAYGGKKLYSIKKQDLED